MYICKFLHMLVLDVQGKNCRLKIWSSFSLSGAVRIGGRHRRPSRLDLMAGMSSCLFGDVATDIAVMLVMDS